MPDHSSARPQSRIAADNKTVRGHRSRIESPRMQTQFSSGGLAQSYYRPRYEIVAGLMNDLALLYRDQSRQAEAEGMFKRALKTYEEARGTQSSGAAMVLQNLGVLYLTERNFVQAE